MSRKTEVHTFFYFIDDSVALLDCGVIGSEAKLVHEDDTYLLTYGAEPILSSR
jgi:hypothetical protein